MTFFPKGSRYQHGLTLVELMVALTIGLFIAGLTAAVFLGTKQSFRHQDNMARLQENARFAMGAISSAVRNAGYRGCGSVSIYANVVTGGASNWWLNLNAPLVGYEGGVSTFPAAMTNVVANTDAFITVGVDASSEIGVLGHNPNSAQISTTQHSIQPGTVLVITDCGHTSVFQMSGPTNNNNNAQNIVHNTGNAVSPGNCYKGLGASCGAGEKNYKYQPGATIMALYSNAFYIAPSASGRGNALWNVALTSGTATTSAAELVEGVDNMQVEYGEDTDGDGVPNRYVVASSVSDWTHIVSARISLLMSTLDDAVSTTAQAYNYNNTAVTASDRRIRRSYTSVITLRNRSQ